MDYFILDEKGRPVQELDIIKFATWFGNTPIEIRRVNLTQVGEFIIYTTFLGIDHNLNRIYDPNQRPLLFETMATNTSTGEWLDQQERYSTREEAEEGHQRWIQGFQNGDLP